MTDSVAGPRRILLDLRPGNVAGLTRAAYLRELFGDIDGAVQMMDAAFHRTPSDEVEDRAWILTQLAHLQLATGKVDNADRLLQHAMNLFPEYHYALAKMAEVRTAQGRHDDALDLQRRRYRAAAHPENLYELAKALERAGRKKEARQTFREFEEQARAEMEGEDNANLELIFYYADHARKPAEALRVARLEIERRRSVHVLDAYAWALHASGEHAEARRQIEKALAVGTRDTSILYHAGVIAARLKDKESARKYLRQSLELNPRSEAAAPARRELARIR